jgi:hypothetical protein
VESTKSLFEWHQQILDCWFSLPENCEKRHQIPSSYSISREIGSKVAIFGAQATRAPVCNILSKFPNTQSVILRIPEVCQEAILEEGKHTGNKLCTYFYTANCFAHNMGWSIQTKIYNNNNNNNNNIY